MKIIKKCLLANYTPITINKMYNNVSRIIFGSIDYKPENADAWQKNCLEKKKSCPSKVKVIQLLTLQKKIMLSKRVNGKCQVRLLMSYGENHVY